MQEIVAVQHPDARIVRQEGDIVTIMRLDIDGVQMDRATREWLPIVCQHRKGVSMEVDRVDQIGRIVQVQPDDLTLLYHNHTSVWEDFAIECVDHALASQ